MTLPLTRDIAENRILRATGATDISVPLSLDVARRLQAPELGGRVMRRFQAAEPPEVAPGAFDAFIAEQEQKDSEKAYLLHPRS